VNHSHDVLLDHISVENSGSRNAKGRNNTSGGILLEQGTDTFTVADSIFRNVRGNAVWTHSYYRSPRNRSGKIANNKFFDIGRDAIQVGHATEVLVAGNTGNRIGYPVDLIDVEGGGTPVAIDTAGDVDRSDYEFNRFEEINGQCIDLDGFHDGIVRGNSCINRGKAEDYAFGHFGIVFNNSNIDMQSQNILVEENELDGMKFGGIFVIGTGHRILRNRMRRLNTAHCNENRQQFGCSVLGEPDVLETGIYLGSHAERPAPARNNRIEGNTISGWKMKTRCIQAAPGVKLADNAIKGNVCSDER
jgi:Right handed beta helix region